MLCRKLEIIIIARAVEQTNSANSRPPSRDASPPVTSLPPPAERDKNLDPAAYNNFQNKQMPHRVEPYSMSSAQPQPAYPYAAPTAPSSKQRRSPYERRASPPPIATLPTHSGSSSPSAASSLDRSGVSTPPVSAPGRRSPPPPAHAPHPGDPQQHHYYNLPRGYQGGYMYAPPPPPPQYHPHPDDAHRGYDGHPHPHAQYAPQPFPIAHGGYVPYPLPGTILSAPMAPPQGGGGAGGIQVVHTDDAATKLSDRVRRRCFNCCTTDTSTWRRSNLSPGKVLCNKCGLFERTHSRPRPEQFPHKRGPLASSTLRSRSPPQAQPYQPPAHYPPPGPAPPPANGSPNPNSSAPVNGANGQQNGSASHPGTPNPQAANPSPKLPGVDSLRAREGEREDRDRDERRERSPE
ncbi:hypothetical protein B0H13DRAFT_2662183 [Mycena leptocephala]|nr:hypothetical protein B0H13DRAFT_2662183 [Mycena leptocephala]